MEQYNDRPISEIRWTKYKIIVPTEQDREDLKEAFEHLHYTDCDTNNVPVNQLIHEYLTAERLGNSYHKDNIIVDKDLYEKITNDGQ
jgi:hypothetical protein